MKHRIIIRSLIIAVATVCATGMVSSCKKDPIDSNPVPAAGLMVYNLTTDQQAVSFRIGDLFVNHGLLGYASSNGRYRGIAPGAGVISVYDSDSTGNVIDSAAFHVTVTGFYAAYLLGDSGHYQLKIVEDSIMNLAVNNGRSYIRYINAVQDAAAPQVHLRRAGADISSSYAPYASLSVFSAIDSGTLVVNVDNAGGINSSDTVRIAEKKIYTLVITGISGATDSSKMVHSKLLVNTPRQP